LKTTDWEFESRPDILEKISSDNKFVQLDRGTSDKMTIKPDKNGSSENNK
jgi:hypothetical protein